MIAREVCGRWKLGEEEDVASCQVIMLREMKQAFGRV